MSTANQLGTLYLLHYVATAIYTTKPYVQIYTCGLPRLGSISATPLSGDFKVELTRGLSAAWEMARSEVTGSITKQLS